MTRKDKIAILSFWVESRYLWPSFLSHEDFKMTWRSFYSTEGAEDDKKKEDINNWFCEGQTSLFVLTGQKEFIKYIYIGIFMRCFFEIRGARFLVFSINRFASFVRFIWSYYVNKRRLWPHIRGQKTTFMA